MIFWRPWKPRVPAIPAVLYLPLKFSSTLYGYQINHKPSDPHWEDRDRVIVSKGHVSPVVYVTLANFGYFPKEELKTFRKFGAQASGPCAYQGAGSGI